MIGFSHLSDIINIVMFMSTGVLTLVGLVSFFGSITLQQKINIARELLNEIESQISNEITFDYGEKVVGLFTRYKRICNSDFKYEKVVINTSRKGLLIIGVVWISIPIITIPSYYPMEWIYLVVVTGVLVFVIKLFYKLMGRLFDIFGLSSLPQYKDLLEINSGKSIELLELVSKSVNFNVLKKDKSIKVEIGFPMIFTGISIFPMVTSDSQKMFTNPHFHYEIENPVSINGDNCFRHLSDKYVWYTLIPEIDYAEFQEFITLQVDLCSKNTSTKVLFSLKKSDIEIENFLNQLYIPEHVSLILSNQSDILAI